MVRELEQHEQVRMSVKEAGRMYNGHAIFFTNSEKPAIEDATKYAIPRVIADDPNDLHDGILQKYFNSDVYGVTLYCGIFLSEKYNPPLLYI